MKLKLWNVIRWLSSLKRMVRPLSDSDLMRRPVPKCGLPVERWLEPVSEQCRSSFMACLTRLGHGGNPGFIRTYEDHLSLDYAKWLEQSNCLSALIKRKLAVVLDRVLVACLRVKIIGDVVHNVWIRPNDPSSATARKETPE